MNSTKFHPDEPMRTDKVPDPNTKWSKPIRVRTRAHGHTFPNTLFYTLNPQCRTCRQPLPEKP